MFDFYFSYIFVDIMYYIFQQICQWLSLPLAMTQVVFSNILQKMALRYYICTNLLKTTAYIQHNILSFFKYELITARITI